MADDLTIPAIGSIVAADEVSSRYYQRIKIVSGAEGIAADAGTYTLSSNFNRPANTTAYTANDLVANSTTAGSVTPLSFALSASAGLIRRVRVKKSDEATATPTIRVWFFESSPTVTNGDNGAFAATLTSSIGYADVDVTNAGSDDAVGWATVDIPVVAATCYGLLQTLSGYTPTSGETYTVTIWYLNG